MRSSGSTTSSSCIRQEEDEGGFEEKLCTWSSAMVKEGRTKSLYYPVDKPTPEMIEQLHQWVRDFPNHTRSSFKCTDLWVYCADKKPSSASASEEEFWRIYQWNNACLILPLPARRVRRPENISSWAHHQNILFYIIDFDDGTRSGRRYSHFKALNQKTGTAAAVGLGPFPGKTFGKAGSGAVQTRTEYFNKLLIALAATPGINHNGDYARFLQTDGHFELQFELLNRFEKKRVQASYLGYVNESIGAPVDAYIAYKPFLREEYNSVYGRYPHEDHFWVCKTCLGCGIMRCPVCLGKGDFRDSGAQARKVTVSSVYTNCDSCCREVVCPTCEGKGFEKPGASTSDYF